MRWHRSMTPHRSLQFKKAPRRRRRCRNDEGATERGVTERNGTIGYIDEFPSGRRRRRRLYTIHIRIEHEG